MWAPTFFKHNNSSEASYHAVLSSQQQKTFWRFVFWFCSLHVAMKRTILIDFLLSIIVDNLPITTPHIYTGAGSMPTETGDGVYLRAGEYLFLFYCNESSCQWHTKMEGLEGLKIGGFVASMMPLPSDYTCQ